MSTPSNAPSGSPAFNPWAFALKNSTILVFFVILIVACLTADNFFTPGNLRNILSQSALLGTVACGMLLVILTGGIDLSVGSLLAMCSIVIALTTPRFGLAGGIAIGMLAGAAAGMVTGLMVSLGKIAPFVASLVMMTVARGAALILSNGNPVRIDSQFLEWFGTEGIFSTRFAAEWFSGTFSVPIIFLVMLAVVLLTVFTLRKTAFGRIVTAIGSNEVAVSHAGIPTRIYVFIVYILCGLACGVGAVIACSRTGVGSPILALGFELDAIAAVVIGGAALSGGRGTAINTLLGALILGVISNYMNILGIPGYHQNIVKGIIIALAVLVEGLKSKSSH